MASYYVYSGAGGSGTGADWANAFTTLAAALSGKAAGDDFYVADDHAETQASAMTLTSPGTAASPCRILCVLRSGGSVPPVAADLRTTATVTTTGANAITFAGFAYCEGITFSGVTGGTAATPIAFNSTSPWWWKLVNCKLKGAGSNASGNYVFGATNSQDDQLLELQNTTIEVGHASHSININCRVIWTNTASAVAGATLPTTLFTLVSIAADLLVQGVDLSALTSGKNIVSISAAQPTLKARFENCKLGSSVTLTTGNIAGQGGSLVDVVNCDSADTNYRYHRQRYQGTITQETTIVRSGGASDGTTPVSRKMVSTANAKPYSPLSFDIMFWNESTSSLSLAAEVVSDGVTFTDAELWMEVEALTTSGFPVSSFTNDRASTILTTAANQSSSSVTWTTTGLASPTKQKLEVSVTPAEKGWIRCRIYLAKASSTVYVCPLITGLGFTSGRQWQTADAYVIEGAGSSSGGVLIPGGMVGGMRG